MDLRRLAAVIRPHEASRSFLRRLQFSCVAHRTCSSAQKVEFSRDMRLQGTSMYLHDEPGFGGFDEDKTLKLEKP